MLLWYLILGLTLAQQQHGEVLVYNRVWRTGSTGMLTLLEKLSARNNFFMLAATEHYWDSALHRKTPDIVQSTNNASTAARIVGKALANAVAIAFNQSNAPIGLIHGHLTIDATRYIEEVVKVRRITIVREPKSRSVSEYTLLQTGPPARLTKNYHYDQNRSIAPLKDCLHSSTCRSWLARICRHQADTVCGTDAMSLCLSSHEDKRLNWLWSNYDFIGSTTELTHSLHYLEMLLPAWFAGAFDYFNQDQKLNSIPRDQQDATVDTFLEAACAVDSELYESVLKAFPTSNRISSCQPCTMPLWIDGIRHHLSVHCDPSLWSDQINVFIANHGLAAGSGACDASCVHDMILTRLTSTCGFVSSPPPR